MSGPPRCAICKDPAEGGGQPPSTLTEKGSDAINRASKSRNDDIHTSPGELVHQVCRKKYTSQQQIAKALKEKEQEQVDRHVRLRSADEEFHYDRDCLFCGRSAHVGTKRKSSDWTVFPVRTVEFKDTLLKSCNERGDAWAVIVKARVLHVHDLHAADAVYHQVCSVNFRTKKQMPAAHQTSETEVKKTKLGRPQDEERFNAFLEVANFLEENDNEQITINDLVSRMENNLKGSECQAYGYTQMKFKLKEQFGDRIIHTEINGKPNVVTFRSTAKAILQDFYAHRKADPETEKKRIIETAAKLIKNDIKSVETYHDVYPDCESLKSEEDAINFLPESLRVLLKGLLGVKNAGMKTASIGQAIIHAILGCDTTSCLYGIGKGDALKKFTTSDDFREQATVFDTPSASTADVVAAGENALVCLYNGKPGEGLNSLRHKHFCEKVATRTSYVQPQSLPPTSAAAKYHSLRVYYQVQQWKGTVDELLPPDWGWKESDGGLIPVQTDLPPAPQELLQVIRCSCKTDCSSLRCTCKKHDIECSVACSNCKGSGCANSFQTECDDDDDDETSG